MGLTQNYNLVSASLVKIILENLLKRILYKVCCAHRRLKEFEASLIGGGGVSEEE